MGGFRPLLGESGEPGGGLPDGVDVGDILFFNGVEWVPNAAGVPAINDILVWDGTNWIHTSLGASIPVGEFPQDILVWNAAGTAWEADQAFPFVLQDDWSVDSVGGSDTNVGTAASPLATATELTRRLNGKVLSPLMATMTILFNGVAFASFLDLHFDSPGATNITIQGTMAAASFSGTIDAYTAFNPAGGVRASLLDAGAVDFTPWKNQRVRITSGAANGGLTSFTSVVALTTANIGQLYTNTMPETATAVNAAAADTYTVENWATSFLGFNINITGPASTVVRDIAFATTSATSLRCSAACGGSRIRMRFFGCKFDTTNAFVASGAFSMIACMHYGNAAGLTLTFGDYQQLGGCNFSNLTCQGSVAGQNNLHDGDGLRSVALSISAGAGVIDSNHRAFFGCINGSGFTSLGLTQGGGLWDLSNANGRFWGAAGNTTTTAYNSQNSSGMNFVTLPTATGNVPGTDLVLSGAAAVAWAAAAAGLVAAPPNNAFCLLRV